MTRNLLIALLLFSASTADALEVFACEPEWAALSREIAGDTVTVTVAMTAYQDPHRLQARPSLIAAVRRADLLICTGADLEVGWLPLLLRRSGNRAIQPGNPGHLMAADFVRKLEVPVRIDRSEGDIHPQGNPHVHLNPHNIVRVANALAGRLGEIDPAHASSYQRRLDEFVARWSQAVDGWEERGAELAGMRLVSHHRSFSYLADWLDLEVVASLEVKPGIPPSTSHLASLIDSLSPNPPAAIIRTPYADPKPSRWLGKRLDIPAIALPYTVGANDTGNLFELFEATLAALEEVAN